MNHVLSRWVALVLGVATLAAGYFRPDDEEDLRTGHVTLVSARPGPCRVVSPLRVLGGVFLAGPQFLRRSPRWSGLSRLGQLSFSFCRPVGSVPGRYARRLGGGVLVLLHLLASLTLLMSTVAAATVPRGEMRTCPDPGTPDPEARGVSTFAADLARRVRYWVNDWLNIIESLIVTIHRPGAPSSSSESADLRIRGRAIQLLEEARVEDDDWYPDAGPHGGTCGQSEGAPDDVSEAVPESK